MELDPPASAGTARRLAAGILLLLAGLAGLLPLALPFGLAHSSGAEAIRYFVDEGADLVSGLCIGLVAAAGLGLSCLGAVLLLPRIRDRFRPRAVGATAIVLALIGTAPAAWLAIASDFRLGGIAIGTYSFFLSGLIGLVGAFPALFGRPRPALDQRSSDGASGVPAPPRPPAEGVARLRDHNETPWGLR